MTFAQQRNRLTTHFSDRIPVVKRRTTEITKRNGVTSPTTGNRDYSTVRTAQLAILHSVTAIQIYES
jgi:hypothetical protein